MKRCSSSEKFLYTKRVCLLFREDDTQPRNFVSSYSFRSLGRHKTAYHFYSCGRLGKFTFKDEIYNFDVELGKITCLYKQIRSALFFA